MNKFYQWWASVYSDRPKEIYRQCYENGYDAGYADGARKVRILQYVLLGMLTAMIVIAVVGCSDRFRYPCQDPANWVKPECQRPTCAATQSCPDQLAKPEEMKGEPR